MTLKIDKRTSEDSVLVHLAGSLSVEYLAEVKAHISEARPRVVLDAGEVTLVCAEGIRLLNACEDNGVAVINASPYIAKWMTLERAATGAGDAGLPAATDQENCQRRP
jgi:hypothetical protein